MHAKSVCRLILAAGLALSVVSSLAAEELRWKFKEGESLDYILQRGVEGQLTLSGAEIKFTMNMIFDTTWKPESVASDGTTSMGLTVNRIQINMASPLFGKMAYDSNNPKEPEGPVWQQMKPAMTGMLGETFTAKITPLGAVSDIKLPKKLADALAAQEIGESRRQGFGIGGGGFDEKGIKELLTKSVLPLPEKADKDTTWMQTFENKIPMIGTQFTETTFSVAGMEKQDGKDLAKIQAATELFFEPDENPRADLEIMEQEASATFYFDPQAGHMVKADGTQNVEMELSGPQELTQKISEKMSMRLGKSPEGPAAESEEKEADK